MDTPIGPNLPPFTSGGIHGEVEFKALAVHWKSGTHRLIPRSNRVQVRWWGHEEALRSHLRSESNTEKHSSITEIHGPLLLSPTFWPKQQAATVSYNLQPVEVHLSTVFFPICGSVDQFTAYMADIQHLRVVVIDMQTGFSFAQTMIDLRNIVKALVENSGEQVLLSDTAELWSTGKPHELLGTLDFSLTVSTGRHSTLVDRPVVVGIHTNPALSPEDSQFLLTEIEVAQHTLPDSSQNQATAESFSSAQHDTEAVEIAELPSNDHENSSSGSESDDSSLHSAHSDHASDVTARQSAFRDDGSLRNDVNTSRAELHGLETHHNPAQLSPIWETSNEHQLGSLNTQCSSPEPECQSHQNLQPGYISKHSTEFEQGLGRLSKSKEHEQLLEAIKQKSEKLLSEMEVELSGGAEAGAALDVQDMLQFAEGTVDPSDEVNRPRVENQNNYPSNMQSWDFELGDDENYDSWIAKLLGPTESNALEHHFLGVDDNVLSSLVPNVAAVAAGLKRISMATFSLDELIVSPLHDNNNATLNSTKKKSVRDTGVQAGLNSTMWQFKCGIYASNGFEVPLGTFTIHTDKRTKNSPWVPHRSGNKGYAEPLSMALESSMHLPVNFDPHTISTWLMADFKIEILCNGKSLLHQRPGGSSAGDSVAALDRWGVCLIPLRTLLLASQSFKLKGAFQVQLANSSIDVGLLSCSMMLETGSETMESLESEMNLAKIHSEAILSQPRKNKEASMDTGMTVPNKKEIEKPDNTPLEARFVSIQKDYNINVTICIRTSEFLNNVVHPGNHVSLRFTLSKLISPEHQEPCTKTFEIRGGTPAMEETTPHRENWNEELSVQLHVNKGQVFSQWVFELWQSREGSLATSEEFVGIAKVYCPFLAELDEISTSLCLPREYFGGEVAVVNPMTGEIRGALVVELCLTACEAVAEGTTRSFESTRINEVDAPDVPEGELSDPVPIKAVGTDRLAAALQNLNVQRAEWLQVGSQSDRHADSLSKSLEHQRIHNDDPSRNDETLQQVENVSSNDEPSQRMERMASNDEPSQQMESVSSKYETSQRMEHMASNDEPSQQRENVSSNDEPSQLLYSEPNYTGTASPNSQDVENEIKKTHQSRNATTISSPSTADARDSKYQNLSHPATTMNHTPEIKQPFQHVYVLQMEGTCEGFVRNESKGCYLRYRFPFSMNPEVQQRIWWDASDAENNSKMRHLVQSYNSDLHDDESKVFNVKDIVLEIVDESSSTESKSFVLSAGSLLALTSQPPQEQNMLEMIANGQTASVHEAQFLRDCHSEQTLPLVNRDGEKLKVGEHTARLKVRYLRFRGLLNNQSNLNAISDLVIRITGAGGLEQLIESKLAKYPFLKVAAAIGVNASISATIVRKGTREPVSQEWTVSSPVVQKTFDPSFNFETVLRGIPDSMLPEYDMIVDVWHLRIPTSPHSDVVSLNSEHRVLLGTAQHSVIDLINLAAVNGLSKMCSYPLRDSLAGSSTMPNDTNFVTNGSETRPSFGPHVRFAVERQPCIENERAEVADVTDTLDTIDQSRETVVEEYTDEKTGDFGYLKLSIESGLCLPMVELKGDTGATLAQPWVFTACNVEKIGTIATNGVFNSNTAATKVISARSISGPTCSPRWVDESTIHLTQENWRDQNLEIHVWHCGNHDHRSDDAEHTLLGTCRIELQVLSGRNTESLAWFHVLDESGRRCGRLKVRLDYKECGFQEGGFSAPLGEIVQDEDALQPSNSSQSSIEYQVRTIDDERSIGPLQHYEYGEDQTADSAQQHHRDDYLFANENISPTWSSAKLHDAEELNSIIQSPESDGINDTSSVHDALEKLDWVSQHLAERMRRLESQSDTPCVPLHIDVRGNWLSQTGERRGSDGNDVPITVDSVAPVTNDERSSVAIASPATANTEAPLSSFGAGLRANELESTNAKCPGDHNVDLQLDNVNSTSTRDHHADVRVDNVNATSTRDHHADIRVDNVNATNTRDHQADVRVDNVNATNTRYHQEDVRAGNKSSVELDVRFGPRFSSVTRNKPNCNYDRETDYCHEDCCRGDTCDIEVDIAVGANSCRCSHGVDSSCAQNEVKDYGAGTTSGEEMHSDEDVEMHSDQDAEVQSDEDVAVHSDEDVGKVSADINQVESDHNGVQNRNTNSAENTGTYLHGAISSKVQSSSDDLQYELQHGVVLTTCESTNVTSTQWSNDGMMDETKVQSVNNENTVQASMADMQDSHDRSDTLTTSADKSTLTSEHNGADMQDSHDRSDTLTTSADKSTMTSEHNGVSTDDNAVGTTQDQTPEEVQANSHTTTADEKNHGNLSIISGTTEETVLAVVTKIVDETLAEPLVDDNSEPNIVHKPSASLKFTQGEGVATRVIEETTQGRVLQPRKDGFEPKDSAEHIYSSRFITGVVEQMVNSSRPHLEKKDNIRAIQDRVNQLKSQLGLARTSTSVNSCTRPGNLGGYGRRQKPSQRLDAELQRIRTILRGGHLDEESESEVESDSSWESQ